MNTIFKFLFALVVSAQFYQLSEAQSLTPYSYDEGTPSVTEYYVNPSTGSDNNGGRSESDAFKTVQKVWNDIPRGQSLSTGVRINLLNGNYGSDELPNYWEDRKGTYAAPIILRAAPGQTGVKFTRDINMAGVSYFYLINVEITPAGGGDTFHCENCDHLLLRGNTLNGGALSGGAHETVKINQSQYVYLENNNILFADDNNIDFVAVQYGHIIGNKIHSAKDWCLYVKGGSAYLRIEANEIYDCGTGGFTAGQGSGFQFMTSPWTHYEAYDIKFINNVVYNTTGAAFGVNGGYNVLLAHNTAYNVGSRSHMMEVVFGERTCDGEQNGAANAQCAARNAEGGWGPSATRTDPEPVGNKNVFILNNVVVNPGTLVSPQHFAIYGPRTARSGTNLPSPQISDTNLVIKGNVIVNGTQSTPLGVEDSSSGCQSGNPTCTLEQLTRDNSINSVAVSFQDPANGDLRPAAGNGVFSVPPLSVSAFSGGDRQTPPTTPEGVLDNSVARDFSGAGRVDSNAVGAFASATSSRNPTNIGDSTTPVDPGGSPGGETVTVTKVSVTQVRTKKKVAFTVTAKTTGSPSTVDAVLLKGTQSLASTSLTSSKAQTYKGKVSAKVAAKARVTVEVTAQGSSGSATKRKTVTVK